MDDVQIIELYWERSEDAIKETDKKYGKYCYYIANRILEDGEDAKEIQNDTYLRVWNTIPPKRPSFFKSYIGTIARNLSLNRYEQIHSQKRGGRLALVLDELSECVADSASEDGSANARLTEALNRFLESLPSKTRAIFMRRYFYASDVCEIANEYAMSENGVSVLLFRTRKKLKDFLEKEGFLNE